MESYKSEIDETGSDELPTTPNERLSGQIVASLLRAGLIAKSDVSRVLDALNSGRAKQEDWVGWISNGIQAK